MNFRFPYERLSSVRASFAKIDWKSRRTIGALALIVVLLGAGAYVLLRGKGPQEAAEESLRTVEMIDIAAYTKQGSVETTANGTREVVMRAEVGGKVARVAQKGVHVALGQIVAELENSSQRAALLQAEGTLGIADSALSKVRRGSREEQQAILGTNVSSAQANLATAKEAAVTALASAYSAVEDAVHRKADPLFTGADSGSPHFSVPTTETQLASQAENTRIALGATLRREAGKAPSISTNDDLAAEIKLTDTELRTTRSFLDTLIAAVNKAVPTNGVTSSDIATYKTDLAAARTNISASISALTTASETLASRTAAISVAQKTQEQGSTADEADVLSASASVKQAQGAYAAALAAYQKTIIRAAAPGTIIACAPGVGDVISTGADVCRIAASGNISGSSFALPLSAVKYTPSGAYVFEIDDSGVVHAKAVETGLVSADSIAVAGLAGVERIVKDIRGLKDSEKVQVAAQ
jgi:multidrug resistance efflux pump